MKNMELWERVFKTDPAHVKPITGKDYGGNSPKPYYIVERLTKEFGPCGIGWGYEIISERFERFSDTDTLHIAQVRLWYMLDDRRGEVTQMGQTKASYVTSKNVFKIDEDAPKKSVTDALVKCASYLGVAGDIFSGRWDDSKYVAELRREFEPKDEGGISKSRKAELDDIASHLIECGQNGKEMDAIGLWYAKDTFAVPHEDGNEERLYVWGLLKSESKLRAAIKANSPHKLEKVA